MSLKPPFSKDIILLDDVESVVNIIIQKLQEDVFHNLKRLGAVIGTSGGIDSSVCLALVSESLWSGKGSGNYDAGKRLQSRK